MGLAATFAYLAIIGFLGWRAWRGSDTEKVMFIVNVILLWLSAIWLFRISRTDRAGRGRRRVVSCCSWW